MVDKFIRERFRWFPALLVIAAASLPLFATGYVRYVATLWIIYAVSAVGLQIPVGLAGVYSFGHSAFMLIGAYALGLCILKLPLLIPMAMPVAIVVGILVGVLVAIAFGALLALPSLRLSTFALAIVTMGAASLLFHAVRSFKVTGGPQGLFLPPLAFVKSMDGRVFYIVALAFLVLGAVVARCVERGDTGRRLRAAAANPLMAQSFGVHLMRTRTMVFVLSAVYGAVAGSLLALSTGYIAPEAYGTDLSIQVFAAVMIGGSNRYWGSILGALFIVLIPELTQSVQNLGPIIYSLLFMAVATAYPGGLQQMISGIVQRLSRRPA